MNPIFRFENGELEHLSYGFFTRLESKDMIVLSLFSFHSNYELEYSNIIDANKNEDEQSKIKKNTQKQAKFYPSFLK